MRQIKHAIYPSIPFQFGADGCAGVRRNHAAIRFRLAFSERRPREVYSNCQDVELFLNGKSQGSKPLPADASPRTWRVLFEPGTLDATFQYGLSVYGLRDRLRTAGKAARIVLSPSSSLLISGLDRVSYVTAPVTGDQGILAPSANNQIAFQIEGPGVIAAVDNADNASHEPFQASSRAAYQGACIAIIRASGAPGNITLRAASAGLTPGSVTIGVGIR